MAKPQTATASTNHARPRITLTASDHERLWDLAQAAMNSIPEAASNLAEELDRARVLPKGQSANTVGMGADVEFKDETTGKIQRMTLVYPSEADIARGRVSVLTPIGTALIGLGVGQSITWETRTGDVKRLTVIAIHKPPSD